LLDEISVMDVSLQAKLLRVIQEREVERLGGRKTIVLDVRILATTNRHLEKEVASGRFREDLFYRLSVFPLYWQPLRERKLDIVPLAQKLLQAHTIKMGRAPVTLDPSAITALTEHHWPGNVRELDNVVRRALIMQPGIVICDAHLRLDPFCSTHFSNALLSNSDAESLSNNSSVDGEETKVLGDDLQRREFEIIAETLRHEGGSRKNTAEKLGISPRTLRYKLARMRDVGINVDTVLQGC
ncbi:MAG: sigma-54-dependent Fis family transcriptional regulator, partial [Spongiibacteraceae bacterium]|nr:sigma-54-dependent Fis family transcriptional regulator [Spongiibacteraceae bacterium]